MQIHLYDRITASGIYIVYAVNGPHWWQGSLIEPIDGGQCLQWQVRPIKGSNTYDAVGTHDDVAVALEHARAMRRDALGTRWPPHCIGRAMAAYPPHDGASTYWPQWMRAVIASERMVPILDRPIGCAGAEIIAAVSAEAGAYDVLPILCSRSVRYSDDGARHLWGADTVAYDCPALATTKAWAPYELRKIFLDE